jgi:hypothetical protein
LTALEVNEGVSDWKVKFLPSQYNGEEGKSQKFDRDTRRLLPLSDKIASCTGCPDNDPFV